VACEAPHIATDGGGCGGLTFPFELLAGYYGLKQVQRTSSKLAPDVTTAAMRVFGRIAAAARKLRDAGGLQVLLDAGDVVTFTRRAARAHGLGRQAALGGVAPFDRTHLNNVPDYVRFWICYFRSRCRTRTLLASVMHTHVQIAGGRCINTVTFSRCVCKASQITSSHDLVLKCAESMA
jgi:hypothetical protein